MKIGYWAAQEQYSIKQLLDFVIEAERTGFIRVYVHSGPDEMKFIRKFGKEVLVYFAEGRRGYSIA